MTDNSSGNKHPATRNPWAWVPSLYFAEGIPYVIVMTVSVIMYKRMGISNTDIALYTSWLYLPWVIKPLWSPIVDLLKTKRLWIVVLQFVIGASLAMVALTLPLPHFFQYTLAVFWLMAFSSATHDIAADGFYMLALPQHDQAAFVGVRSTFYRVAMITGQGLLVVLAGVIETSTGLPAHAVHVAAVRGGPLPSTTLMERAVGPREGETSLLLSPATIAIPLSPRPHPEIDSVITAVRSWNTGHGFTIAESAREDHPGWWREHIAAPVEKFIREHFAEAQEPAMNTRLKGNVSFFTVCLSRPPEAGTVRTVTLGQMSGDQSIKIIDGERLTFDEHNWNTQAAVLLQLDPNLKDTTSATFGTSSGNIPLAWSVTMTVLAILFLLFFVYHRWILPAPTSDVPTVGNSRGNLLREFFRVFAAFFRKKNIGSILAFLLLYRFAESQLVKLVSPFLLDPRQIGGLGLTTSEVGIVYGTVGIIALTLGGLLGGYVVSRHGLRAWLWPMVIIIHFPDLVFVYLSQIQPENFVMINVAVALEQFGYGFGFTAYMMFMILVAEGEHKTAHYAICTGFMALGMMLPGMFSGALEDIIGYQHFFIWVILSTIPGFLVAALVTIPAGFGRKQE